MSKSKSQAPAPPDPNVVARAQSQQNQQAALYNAGLNRFNTYTPFGSQEFSTSGIDPTTGAPIYEQNIKLDPQLEQQYRQQMQQNSLLGNAGGNLVNQINGMSPFSLSGLPGRQDLGDIRQQSQDALYARNTEYLDPQFQRGEDSLRTRLANQGIVEGSEAYRNAVSDFDRGKETAYRQARNESIIGGGAETDRAFSMDEQLRNNALSEYMLGRQQPYSELGQIRGLTGIESPQFAAPSQVGIGAPDIQSLYNQQYQGQLDSYNSKQQGKNNLMSGLFSLGSSAILASDERVKEDIEPIGELQDGTNLYLFRYKGDDKPQVGVMAQEVEKRDPGAIHERNGVKHVDYARVLSRALEAA